LRDRLTPSNNSNSKSKSSNNSNNKGKASNKIINKLKKEKLEKSSNEYWKRL